MNNINIKNNYRIVDQCEIKEYNSYNDKLLFEGKFLNGKRNGIGKEYNGKGVLIFEGEYLNDKNGKDLKIYMIKKLEI